MLGLLLLRAGEVVPVEGLVDDLWGEDPPGSATHTLEAYVSRLRATLEPHGSTIARRGRGYVVELGGAELDVRRFKALVDAAAAARSAGDHVRAGALAADALAQWRGRPLLDASFATAPVEIAKLEETRRRVLEIQIDADLAAGRHAEVVGELRALVDDDPYAEGLVAQLMIALYRTGRQADAVAVYEDLRRRMADELGLRPSPELQALSAQVVRHEEQLAAPTAQTGQRRPRRAWAALLAAVAVLASAAFAAWEAHSRESGAASPHAPRVALIVSRLPKAGREDTFVTPFLDGLALAARHYGLQTEVLLGEDSGPLRSPVQQRLLGAHLRRGRFDLVIVSSQGEGGKTLNDAIAAMPHTRFVFIDAYRVRGWTTQQQPNVTLVQFADEQAGYLAGYLTGLLERAKAHARSVVSVVGVRPGGRPPGIPQVTHLVDGFVHGVHRSAPKTRVLISWSTSFVDREQCARLATRQIDAGSQVVFAAAGTCGLGALAVAASRGVRAVGADQDMSYLGSHVLVSTLKRLDRAVLLSVRWFMEGTLPRGGDVLLGLDQDAVGVAGISDKVPQEARIELTRETAALRQRHDGRAP